MQVTRLTPQFGAAITGVDLGRLDDAQFAAIPFPQGGLMGDWKRGEAIAQSGRGMQWNDGPKDVAGGSCYNCHQLSPQESSYGTLGPSLLGFGKLRGNSAAIQKYTYGRIYNAKAYNACSRMPRNGDQVEITARLGVYESRGDLQLVVEALRPLGQGSLYEEFLRLKAKLQGEGLFDPEQKRPIPRSPRAIGLITSLGAAALHDVATALQRRVPHIPVVLVPAQVQGAK